MLGKSFLSLFVALSPLRPSLVFAGQPGHYLLSDTYIGGGFLVGFEHEAIEDPTGGHVTYVDEKTALANNLTYASWDTFIIRADDKNIVTNDTGRMSVRIRSRKTYTKHVAVLDVRHMPEGCATWPAFWETREDNWPEDGEVDIIEGVNDLEPNKMTLHTTANCTMPANRTMLGTSLQDDCDYTVNYNAGCGVTAKKASSYGPAFNAAGGGWYAMERTNESIRVFFWSREETDVPEDVAKELLTVNPDRWGIPSAYFPNVSCDFEEHFGAHNIIINLTLCGSWAGAQNVYGDEAGCPGTCVDYVNDHPEAFKDAYWEFAAVRVYE